MGFIGCDLDDAVPLVRIGEQEAKRRLGEFTSSAERYPLCGVVDKLEDSVNLFGGCDGNGLRDVPRRRFSIIGTLAIGMVMEGGPALADTTYIPAVTNGEGLLIQGV